MAPEQAGSRHPQIRIHRYERAVAVKWPDDDRWFIAWGEAGASAEWRDNPNDSLHFDKLLPHDEWMDPVAEYRKDVTPWTARVRQDMESIERTLRGMENHPWS